MVVELRKIKIMQKVFFGFKQVMRMGVKEQPRHYPGAKRVVKPSPPSNVPSKPVGRKVSTTTGKRWS